MFTYKLLVGNPCLLLLVLHNCQEAFLSVAFSCRLQIAYLSGALHGHVEQMFTVTKPRSG